MSVSSCNYLNMVPEKDIETIESAFERRNGAELWWSGLYGDFHKIVGNIIGNAAYLGADEYIASQIMYTRAAQLDALNIAAGQQMVQEPFCPMWASMYRIIRNCNIFIKYIPSTYDLSQKEKDWWMADVKALKAQIYFELMRHYGPICLVDEAMPVDLPIEKYQLPRQPVDVCFKHIVDLLDEASTNIPMAKDRTYAYGHTISLEGLYALKAKVLLYAASPLYNNKDGNIFYSDFVNKNGEHLFSSKYDHNKWLLAAEAADEAAEVCARGDRRLYKHTGTRKTLLLNKMSDIEFSVLSNFDNPEFLLEAKIGPSIYSTILPRLEGDDLHYNTLAGGCLSPSMKMVEMYYTVNGLPIDSDNDWNYSRRYTLGSESSYLYEDVLPLNTEVINLHLQREPRFYACIAGDRMYYQRGINTLNTSYNLLVKAHKGEEPWGTPFKIITSNEKQNITGYWQKKFLSSDIPTKTYHDHLKRTETVPLIRLAEVFLMQAEAWNEYLKTPDDRVYNPINLIRDRAGIPTVKDSWKNYSNQPTKYESQEGMRDIIRAEYNIELAFEGHRYWNIRRWMIAHEVMNQKQYCWNVLGTDFQSFYYNEKGPAYEINKYKFIAPRDYLAPIKAEQILISGMKQNPNW